MKKILYVATVDIHIKTFHLPYLKMLHDMGYEVHVATNGKEEFPNCDKKHTICIERSPYKLNNIKAIKQLKKIIDKEKFDIIHCHTPMGSVVTRLAAKNARKKYGTRVIYTAHGFHFYKGAPLLNWLLFYPIEKWLAKYTDTLITINKEDCELANKKFKYRCKNIEYVPGVGIDTKKFDFEMSQKERNKLRKSLNLKDDDFVILYPAELSDRKRQLWLINSLKYLFKKNEKIHLLLAGKDSLNGKCQQLVKMLNLEKQIHFLGYRNDIPKLLKIANLSVSSAKQEGLPVNIIEAMYMGVPIVASDCRGNSDLIKDGYNGYLINLYDADNFLNKIEKLYKNEQLYEKLSKNNKNEIKKFIIDNIMPKIKEIYSKNTFSLIIPSCTDLNRGDQALVYETASIIKETYNSERIYMMINEEYTKQCEEEGLFTFHDILKHPSRFSKKNKNINYNFLIKIKWGVIAIFDFLGSIFILNNFTRKIILPFLKDETKKSIFLYQNCEACFVKGGGFLHDYNGGIIGIYTTYYQLFHIKLAQKMGKKVYVMPNSYGPFKSKISKNMTLKVLKKCQLVTARESISANGNTNGLGIDIILKPDLAFFLKKNRQFDVKKYFESKKIPYSDKYVAITVRPYRFSGFANPTEKYEKYKESFKDFIVWLNTLGYKPLMIVHTRATNDHENDEKCIKEICSKIKDKKMYYVLKDDKLSCRELKSIYGECKFIIGTRFHSVIFSISQKIPAISITYGGNKGDGITKDINGGKYSIKIDELSFDKLKNKFLLLENEKDKEIQRIEDYLNKSIEERKKLVKCILKAKEE